MNSTSTENILLALLAGPGAETPWRAELESTSCLGASRYDDPAQALAQAAQVPRTIFMLDASLADGPTSFWVNLLRSCRLGPIVWIDEPSSTADCRKAEDLVLEPEELPEGESEWQAWIEERWADFESAASGVESAHKLGTSPPLIDDSFIADSLHEFRTPVTVVQQFAALIQDGCAGEVTERQLEYLERIRVASRNIVTLFDDFRMSSRARLGAMPRVRGRVDVADLLLGCAAEAGPEHAQVDVNVPTTRLEVHGDDEVLQLVFARLALCARSRAAEGERVRLGIGTVSATHVELTLCYRGQAPSDHEIEVFEQGVRKDGLQRKSVTKVFGVGVELARTLLLLSDSELCLERLSREEGRIRVLLPLYSGSKR